MLPLPGRSRKRVFLERCLCALLALARAASPGASEPQVVSWCDLELGAWLQMAVQLTTSYPFYPDVVALVESVARRFPQELNTDELMGLHLPPSGKNLLKTEPM